MKTGLVTFAAAALAATFSLAAPANAAIDKELTVNVYQLCNSAGSSCASLGPSANRYYAAETNDIWSQAGIRVSFNFVQTLYYDVVYDIDDRDWTTSFNRLANAFATANPTGVNMFLVNSINTYAGGITYGEAYQGSAGLVIAMNDVVPFNNGAGRTDTIAHELGHNLGLVPDSMGGSNGHSSAFYELMASGATRCIPGAFCASTVPDGLRLDYLTPGQIALARQSALLSDVAPVPEPGEWAMMIAGIAVVGFAARRRRAA